MLPPGAVCQGAVPKGSATTENLQKLGYKDGDVVYKCNKCLCIKPDRAHHCRSDLQCFVLLTQGGHKPGRPGILRDFSEHGKLREFSGNSVQPQGKIVT